MTEPQASGPVDATPAPLPEAEGATDTVPTAEHAVTDRYVARRLAEGAAAREEAERREAAQAAAVSEPPQGTFAFYIILGIIISILLLLVILQTPGRSPTPPAGTVTSPR